MDIEPTLRMSTVKLGEHRGKPRVYLQGKWLAKANFTAGAPIVMHILPGCISIQLDPSGDRTVSGKKDGSIPVIDLNTDKLNEVFRDCKTLQLRVRENVIYITPARTEQQRRTRVRNGLEGSLFSGGGLLTQAAKQVGYRAAFAVEWDERYAEIYERNHPEARMFNMSVSEVPLRDLPQVELMTVGIPCEPFSNKRRSAEKNTPPEAHELGDMVFWALRIIDYVNPYTVVVEEVPGFLESGAGFILLHALRRMGYHVEHQHIDPSNYGELTGRKRVVIVATTDDRIAWPEEDDACPMLGMLLEPDAGGWFTRETKPWLFEHWDKQTAKGNGFASQQLTEETVRVQAISKRYFAGQGDCPVVKHPTEPGTFRWLTVNEVKRLHGLPDDYYLGEAKTTAGEVLGQGVVVSTFEKVVRCATGRN